MIIASPRAVALRIISALSPPGPTASLSYSLAQHQAEAVAQANAIIAQRNGVILSDGVGLGKTYIAAALIEQRVLAGNSTLIVIPSPLRKQWRAVIAPLTSAGPRITLASHGQLSRGPVKACPDFVVVDEAHAFRNPHTRRYRSLRLAAAGAQVLLISATPVNNSLADLYFLIRIFAADDGFRDLGIGSLSLLLRSADADQPSLDKLRSAVVIRRSRNDLGSDERHGVGAGPVLAYPRHVRLESVSYTPLIEADSLRPFLTDIRFAAWRDMVAGPLLWISLLKRMQSGRAAALTSLERIIALHRRVLDGLGQGRRLRPELSAGGDPDQLILLELVAEPLRSTEDATRLAHDVAREMRCFERLRDLLKRAADHKLLRLRELLAARAPPARTLVFTEFQDTAFDLGRQLCGTNRVGLITGNSARLGNQPASRWEVIRRFAPLANGAPEPAAAERVDVLIATDVLSEGLNLQDADAVVNYDLPWNPVRLIQRAGRIDRIGSLHAEVTILNFLPDRDFDRFVGLLRILREKVLTLRSVVGHESPILDSEEIDPAFLHRLTRSDPDLLRDSAGPLLHVKVPKETAAEDLAPEGAYAFAATSPAQTLVAFRTDTAVRLFLVRDCGVFEDRSQALHILEKALTLTTPRPRPSSELIDHALREAQAFLAQERAGARAGPETALIRGAVDAALRRLGLLVTPALTAQAEMLMGRLGGYTRPPRHALQLLHAAVGSGELARAFHAILEDCPQHSPAPPVWRLLGAIAVD